MFESSKKLFVRLQDEICQKIEEIEGTSAKFHADEWHKEDGFGRGRSCVLKAGNVFEQAGVNWSQVCAKQLPPSVLDKFPDLVGKKFYATGISLVIHPRSPMCPTVHANYRFFQVMESHDDGHNSRNVAKWWFGGGMDLTPYYLFDEDAVLFHSSIQKVCDEHSSDFFPIFSEWADKYFYIKHRKEHRGIGGLFFDYLSNDVHETPLYRINDNSFEFSPELRSKSEKLFSASNKASKQMDFHAILMFVTQCGELFSPVYDKIIRRRMLDSFSDNERQWQLYRRGRYVEFNLVYDRGTVFGLQTAGRVESILMSLPPLVRFEYCFSPKPGSPEHRLWQVLKEPRKWC